MLITSMILHVVLSFRCTPFPAVVTRTERGNANICILCDVIKKVERRIGAHAEFPARLSNCIFRI